MKFAIIGEGLSARHTAVVATLASRLWKGRMTPAAQGEIARAFDIDRDAHARRDKAEDAVGIMRFLNDNGREAGGEAKLVHHAPIRAPKGAGAEDEGLGAQIGEPNSAVFGERVGFRQNHDETLVEHRHAFDAGRGERANQESDIYIAGGDGLALAFGPHMGQIDGHAGMRDAEGVRKVLRMAGRGPLMAKSI